MEINKSNFQSEVLESKVPVVADFYANWCGPCRRMPPILSEVETKMGDQVKIVKINVDSEPELSEEYSISSIPTLLYFKNGNVVQFRSGISSVDEIIGQLRALV